MPRGQPRAYGSVQALSEARQQRALDLADLLHTLAFEGDERLSTGAGRLAVAREAGLSEGEFRRRLADARQLLASDDSEQAAAVFGFGVRTVLIEGARYRTRIVRPTDIEAGRLYAFLSDGEVVGTFAGDSLEAPPVATGTWWRRVRSLQGQGFSSTDAIQLASGESEEAHYVRENVSSGTFRLVELRGSEYPGELDNNASDIFQRDFID